jgi:hypothetical protein
MKKMIVILSTIGLMSCSAYKIEVKNNYYTAMERKGLLWKRHWFQYSTEEQARKRVQELKQEAYTRKQSRKKHYIKIK